MQFSQRDLWQHVRRRFSVKELGDVLNLLTDMGYVRPNATSASTGSGRPGSPVFEVNPLAQGKRRRSHPSGSNSEDIEDSEYVTSSIEDSADVGEV